jgi:hypothetical protein
MSETSNAESGRIDRRLNLNIPPRKDQWSKERHEAARDGGITRREAWRVGGLGVSAILLANNVIPDHGRAAESPSTAPIPALMPRDDGGHQFVIFADCCSGIPGTIYEKNLRSVNAIVARIQPSPEWILFPGDAISGGSDAAELRRQWDYWHNTEMKWLQRTNIPLYQSTSNHDTYDGNGEQVFREVHAALPKNGPSCQVGLAYFVRHGSFLYISTHQPNLRQLIVHDWLDKVLTDNAEAKYKFVAGHYPVHPVNGYIAHPLWCFPPEERRPFWDLLVKHGVAAYICSHIIAFDVQVHDGVLQVLTGGAGTLFGPGGFMPGRSEYLHVVQMTVDQQGLRYLVRDIDARVREQLCWPLELPPTDRWTNLDKQSVADLLTPIPWNLKLVAFRFSGTLHEWKRGSSDQTLLCGTNSSEGVEPVWIGVNGDSGRLMVQIVPVAGEGWQVWKGPLLSNDEKFDFQLALHPGMGPGGVLFRKPQELTWSSLMSTSSKGIESLKAPMSWVIGNAQSGSNDRRFAGKDLKIEVAVVDVPGVELSAQR